MRATGCFAIATAVLAALMVSPAGADERPPIRVLLIAGGCCHNYARQTADLKAGIESRINAEVTVVLDDETTTRTRFDLYTNDRWAEGYDVVLHDECSADVTDKAYVQRILAEHRRGVPCVNLHCAMHSYRWGDYRRPVEDGADNAAWYEMLGIQSSGHGPKAAVSVSFTGEVPAVSGGLDNWTTSTDELYNNLRVFDGVTPVAMGEQLQPPSRAALKQNPDAPPQLETAIVAWTHTYGPKNARVFCLTLGHTDAVVESQEYLDLVARGVAWAAGQEAYAEEDAAPADRE